MTSTALCTKPKAESSSWAKLFVDVDTCANKSTMLMKRLLALGISSIMFCRRLLPDYAFSDRTIGDKTWKLLRNDCNFPVASKVIAWIKAAFEPISKNWLRNFYLVIRDRDNKRTIETYTFKFQYADDGQTEIYRNQKKISGVENKMVEMLTNISAMMNPLSPLPCPCIVSTDLDMNRSTVNYQVPRELNIPGFATIEALFHAFEDKKVAVHLGDINTAFHECKLQIRTGASRLHLEGHDRTQANGQKTLTESGQKMDSELLHPAEQNATPQKRSQQFSPDEDVTSSKKRKVTEKQVEDIQETSEGSPASHSNSEHESGDMSVAVAVCPCQTSTSGLALITCSRCGELQHQICYGFPPYLGDHTIIDPELVDNFLCFHCSPYLQEQHKFSILNFKMLCLARQVVAEIIENGEEQICHPILSKYKSVKTRLIKEKIIAVKKPGNSLQRIKRSVERADQAYFDSLKTYMLWSKPMEQTLPKKRGRKLKAK